MAYTATQLNTIYQNVLFRPVDISGINSYANSSTINDAQVRQAIETSAEAQANVAPIVRLYEAAFGRVPDIAGLSANVRTFEANVANNGNNLQAYQGALTTVAQAFASSPEFTQTYGTGVSANLIQQLYRQTFQRDASPAEIAGRLANGQTAAQQLLDIANSPEAQQREAAFVTSFLDQAALGTAPTGGTIFAPTGGSSAPGGGGVYNTILGGETATANVINSAPVISPITGAQINTLDFTDSLTGTGTNPTLNFIDAGSSPNVSPTLTGIQTINVTDVANGGNGGLSLANATGVTTINVNRAANTGGTEVIQGIKAGVTTFGVNSIPGGTANNVAFVGDATAFAGSADAITLNLANNGTAALAAGSINISGAGTGTVETLTINSTGTNHFTNITSDTANGNGVGAATTTNGLGTIKAMGAGSLTIDNALTNTTVFDASMATGAVSVVLDATKNVTATGGSAADTFNFGAGLTTADVVNGGDGRDTIRVTNNNAFVTGNQITAVEILRVDGAGAATYDVSKVASIDAVVQNSTGATVFDNFKSSFAADVTKGVTDLNTGNITVNVFEANLTTPATQIGTNDVLQFNIGNTSAAGSALQTTGATQAAGTLTTAGVETINEAVAVAGNGLTATSQGVITDAGLITHTITGGAQAGGLAIGALAQGVGAAATTFVVGTLATFGGGQDAGVTSYAGGTDPVTIDASGFQGNIAIGGTAAGGQSITGGVGQDVLSANGRAAFTGAGATPTIGDVITGGAGNDVFTLKVADNAGAQTNGLDLAYQNGGYYKGVSSFSTANLQTFTSITDLNLGGNGNAGGAGGDKIDLPNGSNAAGQANTYAVANGGSVVALQGANFADAVNTVFAGGGALDNAATTRAAGLFSYGGETFLLAHVTNAGGAGFDGQNDLIVRVTGVTGQLDVTDIR